MTIQYKFFTIPIKNLSNAEEEFNKFIRSVRLITLHREFVPFGENSFWAIAVEYLSGNTTESFSRETKSAEKRRIDYKDVLSQEDFALFAKLREWRKTVADKEAVPVYTIFNNEQLSKIVEKKITCKSELQKISGIGEARIKKYGDAVIEIVTQAIQAEEQKTENETEKQPVLFDS